MNKNQYSKRPRNRARRPLNTRGGYSPNRVFESNGPDVKIRGTAMQVHDKYLTLARDAQSSGDRVAAEGYFQYAEHYQRLISAMHEHNDNAAQQQKDGETRGEGDQPNGAAHAEQPREHPREQPREQPRAKREARPRDDSPRKESAPRGGKRQSKANSKEEE
ncbi:MAG: DUF4167 domain-containing protein [Hyphomicrobiales bacterium]|nr:DUF4167 domain-containing protein [Hyphomicrobiales bacterium]MCY4049089.1 DUF4167 domain-containing protein [Hyphomicrobiales bacterium]